jgi:Nucleotidyl transferase of unknown function (DUF2204)
MGIHCRTSRHAGRALDGSTRAFYRDALHVLGESGVPFLVGGAYALQCYTGIQRHTKDFDVFVRPVDCELALHALTEGGYRTALTFPHWLGKAFCGDAYVDVIFSSGNGVARVDDTWFVYATEGRLFGRRVRVIPPEEMIWSKAFVQERERYDGADVLHLLRARGDSLDWGRLLERFGEHWRVLFGHLALFGYVYPEERAKIPSWLLRKLSARLLAEQRAAVPEEHVCNGTIISREQYLADIRQWGYEDGRLHEGVMNERDIAHWTDAIGHIA